MATFLSVEDFDLILAKRDGARRASLTCRLFADFEAGVLDDSERHAAHSIFRALARDSDVDVRARFARFVAPSIALEPGLAARMAGDVRAVASPVIRRSPVLADAALVDIAASPDGWRQMALARRARIAAPVAAALIEVAGPDACRALIANSGASLPAFAFDRLIVRFPDHHQLRDALVSRPDAPGALVEQHISAVADRLTRFVTQAGWLDGTTARSSAGSARDQALIAYANGRTPESLAELVARWGDCGRINREFLLRTAICGSIGVFEHCAAALARLPVKRVRALVRDRGVYGLRSMCARMGFGRSLENDLVRIRMARALVAGEGRHPLGRGELTALIGHLCDPQFALSAPLSAEAAPVVADIAQPCRATGARKAA